MVFVGRHDWAYRGYKRRTRWRGTIQGGVAHWPGSKFVIKSPQDEIDLLNSILRYHLDNGYNDIAYNFAIGRYGHIYELRGAEYQSGAHSPLNATHEAYLFLCSTDEQPPKAMLNTASVFISTRRQQGVGGDMKAHSDIKPTACPGGPLKDYMASLTGTTTPPSNPAPTPPSTSPSTILRRGAKGQPVRDLQTLLNKHGAKLKVDGDFGSLTEQAVRAFQQQRKIEVDGIAGPQTFRELGKQPTSKIPKYSGLLKRGSKGANVKRVQARLNERGWKHQGRPLVEDGIFGPATEQVVRWFQADKRLTVDGLVGPATWRALWESPIT